LIEAAQRDHGQGQEGERVRAGEPLVDEIQEVYRLQGVNINDKHIEVISRQMMRWEVDHIVLDGMPPAEEWTPGSGTYTVNPDCTGSAVIHSQSSPDPVNLHFVVVNDGTEIHQVVDANAVTDIGIKVK